MKTYVLFLPLFFGCGLPVAGGCPAGCAGLAGIPDAITYADAESPVDGDGGPADAPTMLDSHAAVDVEHEEDTSARDSTIVPDAPPDAPTCMPGYTECLPGGPFSYCADLKTDPQNCGACGNECIMNDTCSPTGQPDPVAGCVCIGPEGCPCTVMTNGLGKLYCACGC
jgi:hypothetical protein